MEKDFTVLWEELKNIPFNNYADFEKTILTISNFFANKILIEKGSHPHPDSFLLHTKLENPSIKIQSKPRQALDTEEWNDIDKIHFDFIFSYKYRIKPSETIFEYQYYISPCFQNHMDYPKLSPFLTDEEFEKMPKAKGLKYEKIECSKKERFEIPMNKKDL